MTFQGPDMARVTVAYLLIATVLICPYLCLGEETEAVACAQAVGCSCSYEPLGRDNDAPASPEGDEHDCLCQGAIEAAKVDDSILGADELTLCWVILQDSEVSFPTSACSTLGPRHSVHFPPLSTGREICTLVNARLL
jgi:hypothetical protein